MMGLDEMDDTVKEDLAFILQKAPFMIDMMIQMAIVIG
jgi:hypothetical protein